MSMYYVGLDVHKASIRVAVLNAAGKLAVESVVETSAATVLDSLKGPRGRVEVTFEEGAHAAWLYDVPHKSAAGVSAGDGGARDRGHHAGRVEEGRSVRRRSGDRTSGVTGGRRAGGAHGQALHSVKSLSLDIPLPVFKS
jgi:hypothetical protein